MAKPYYPPFVLEDCQLLFPNFAGIAKERNAEGDRNTCVIVSDELAAELESIGWNVRTGKTTDTDVAPNRFISVTVKTDSQFPPRLWLISPGRQPQLMHPDEYNILDFSKFKSVSLKVNNYVYSERPQKVSGFLEEGYFELMPDRLRERYFNRNDQA